MSSSQSEKRRQEQLERKRQEVLAEYASQREKLASEAEKDRTAADRFVKVTETMEEKLKKSTVGLVHAEDFKKVREELEEENRRKAAQTNELEKDDTKKRKKKKDKKGAMLSFADDEEQDESTNGANGADAESRAAKKAKFGKNPSVDTSFLPDREREEQERKIREELRQQYLKEQERIKQEDIDIVCSFWDGAGHRSVVTCKKGDTIKTFLDKSRQQFPQIKNTSVDNLMYIKEDLIIPHHLSFYDFIASKARGKSGPLFQFDVHDDVRMLADASVEKNESHAGKIVERAWYNRNKHVFPSSRWEPFDPEKKYTSYTIKDTKKT
ncbi:XAP5-domain-containing protein [Cystobasidium minutum MCA 4210]|uniref:XAP5-domain-containing protein n=1 Tax=Cystobasidium minutum MCA 4210 TaxID=1397322 RepID=UPI0034CDA362|eukprot:jgi/Rhomi1/169189/fgenesh1_kg.3_\